MESQGKAESSSSEAGEKDRYEEYREDRSPINVPLTLSPFCQPNHDQELASEKPELA